MLDRGLEAGADCSGMSSGPPRTSIIQLLVTLNGHDATVQVERLAHRYRRRDGDVVLVAGRSFGDVLQAIQQAARESQGRPEGA